MRYAMQFDQCCVAPVRRTIQRLNQPFFARMQPAETRRCRRALNGRVPTRVLASAMDADSSHDCQAKR